MKTSVKNDYEVFRDALDNIPRVDYQRIKDEIITNTLINDSIFYDWRSRTKKIPPLAKIEINRILKSYKHKQAEF